MRAARTTKEITVDELEQLTHPEARETAAFDPSELQSLLAASRDEDDLALPIESSTFAASSGAAVPIAPAGDLDDAPSRQVRGSARTPNAMPITRPRHRASSSLLPWIVVALAAAVVIALALWR